jgi:hypothetical protein
MVPAEVWEAKGRCKPTAGGPQELQMIVFTIYQTNNKFYIYYRGMCYSNVVFNQRIARNVDKDEVEHQRINDRGTRCSTQLASRLASRQPATSSSNLPNNHLLQLAVRLSLDRSVAFQ